MDREAHDRLDALQRDPYPLYARARAAEGLTFVPELDAWLVARDADVREVLRRADEFSSVQALRPDVIPSPAAFAVLAGGFGGQPTVVSSDGPAHQRHRAPLNRGLSTGRVGELLPFVARRSAELIDEFEPHGTVELVEAYARRLPSEVVGRLIGLDPVDVPAAVYGSNRAEQLLFRPLPEDEQIAAAHDVVELHHLLDSYVRDRRAAPRDDLLSGMVEALAPEPGELTLDQRHELVSNVQNLFIAGHLTTTAVIGTAFLHLLGDRRQWELLCEQPESVHSAVEEALRYDTAVQGFRRTTTREVTLSGTVLPAGSVVFVAYGSANRDEQRHERPDVFDITRRPTRHVAFGYGTHGCPGSQLAREQLRITLELFSRRLPGLRFVDEGPGEMLPTLIHRAPEHLHLTW
ncbi:cytochrome P450 [Streptomyces sp. NPDC050504]|uniref:cytochrome P450 n=1 Tax=Streptomyces sp. NPDC050504 TaxID=3365618 RepID=UPI00378A389F